VNSSILDPIKQVDHAAKEVDALSMYLEFEKIQYGRKSKGKRYPLAFIFTVLCLGKMAGETTLEGIIDWIDERKQNIKRLLNWSKRFPVIKTYIDALAKCDHHEVTKALAHVFLKANAVQKCGDEPSWLLAQKE
jgi:hypothetical protein